MSAILTDVREFKVCLQKYKLITIFLFLVGWDWVHLVRRPLFGLLYQPQMIDHDDDDCGAIGGMRIGRGNRSTRRKPALAPLCPPQIPHDLIRATTRAAVVRSRRLTTWAIARPLITILCSSVYNEIWKQWCPYYCLHFVASTENQKSNWSLHFSNRFFFFYFSYPITAIIFINGATALCGLSSEMPGYSIPLSWSLISIPLTPHLFIADTNLPLQNINTTNRQEN
jgi:hypothetical protein